VSSFFIFFYCTLVVPNKFSVKTISSWSGYYFFNKARVQVLDRYRHFLFVFMYHLEIYEVCGCYFGSFLMFSNFHQQDLHDNICVALASLWWSTKVEIPYHDNDLILTPIISPQSGWHWTSSCPELHMGSFRDGGWQFLTFGRCHWMELPIFNTYIKFSRHHVKRDVIFVASQLFLCLFWISLWLRIGVYNTLASKICVKPLKPPKIHIPMLNTFFWIC
jgi:hypothetical protein